MNWIPAYAGMTKGQSGIPAYAGMTKGQSGIRACVGMTEMNEAPAALEATTP